MFTGVDISYDLEPTNKTATLLLKGRDWNSRNWCKEKQEIYDNQCMNHMTDCVDKMYIVNSTDYDRYWVGILEKQFFFTNTSSLTFRSNNVKLNIRWKIIY